MQSKHDDRNDEDHEGRYQEKLGKLSAINAERLTV